jgi:hypothetical protein
MWRCERTQERIVKPVLILLYTGMGLYHTILNLEGAVEVEEEEEETGVIFLTSIVYNYIYSEECHVYFMHHHFLRKS